MADHYFMDRYRTTNRVLVIIIIAGMVFTSLFILPNSMYWRSTFIYRNNVNNTLKSSISVKATSIALCVILRVHIGHRSYLPITALSFLGTGFDKVRLYAVNIDKNIDKNWLTGAINLTNTIVGRADYITLLDVGSPEEDQFGFVLIDRALLYLYKQYDHSPSTCDYLILTNSDNLYSRHLGKNVLPLMRAKVDVIGWDFVSRYDSLLTPKVTDDKKQIAAEIVDNKSTKCILVALEIGHADFGSATYRVAFLRQRNHYIHDPSGNYNGMSDGYFIQTAASLTNASVIVRQTLFIHQ